MLFISVIVSLKFGTSYIKTTFTEDFYSVNPLFQQTSFHLKKNLDFKNCLKYHWHQKKIKTKMSKKLTFTGVKSVFFEWISKSLITV